MISDNDSCNMISLTKNRESVSINRVTDEEAKPPNSLDYGVL